MHSKETEIRETNVTVQNYFHYLPAKPYTIQTSCVALEHQFSQLLPKRAGAKKLVSYQANPKNGTDFSDATVIELLKKHQQSILLNGKV